MSGKLHHTRQLLKQWKIKTGEYDCLEDTKWAAISFACIQLPAIVLAISWGLQTSDIGAGEKRIFWCWLLLLLPLLIYCLCSASGESLHKNIFKAGSIAIICAFLKESSTLRLEFAQPS